MQSKEIVVSKKTVYIMALVFAILAALIVLGGRFSVLGFGQVPNIDSSKLVAGSPEKFDVLSSHGTRGNVGST